MVRTAGPDGLGTWWKPPSWYRGLHDWAEQSRAARAGERTRGCSRATDHPWARGHCISRYTVSRVTAIRQDAGRGLTSSARDGAFNRREIVSLQITNGRLRHVIFQRFVRYAKGAMLAFIPIGSSSAGAHRLHRPRRLGLSRKMHRCTHRSGSSKHASVAAQGRVARVPFSFRLTFKRWIAF